MTAPESPAPTIAIFCRDTAALPLFKRWRMLAGSTSGCHAGWARKRPIRAAFEDSDRGRKPHRRSRDFPTQARCRSRNRHRDCEDRGQVFRPVRLRPASASKGLRAFARCREYRAEHSFPFPLPASSSRPPSLPASWRRRWPWRHNPRGQCR